MLSAFNSYYKDEIVDEIVKVLPKSLKFLTPLINKKSMALLNNMLELNVRITRKYTNNRYYEEMKAIG